MCKEIPHTISGSEKVSRICPYLRVGAFLCPKYIGKSVAIREPLRLTSVKNGANVLGMSELLKPLVLEIWERDEECPDVYYNERTGISDLADEDKRLTPSECAAEYWRATRDTWEAREFGSYGGLVEGWPNDAGDCYERESTLERFAVLPHCVEED